MHAVGQYSRSKTSADDKKAKRPSDRLGQSYNQVYLCNKCNSKHIRAAFPAYNKKCLNKVSQIIFQ